MVTIINRYLAREVLFSWMSVTVVLLFVLLSNQFARVLGDAAAGKLPRDAVLSIIGLTSLSYLTVLVPVSLFLAVMLALGRLYRDSEMSALGACGLGPLRIYRPIGFVSVLLALMLAWLSLYAAPWAAARTEQIIHSARQQSGLGALEPGRFQGGSDGALVFYAEGVDEQGTLQNVFLQRRRGSQVAVAVADSGEIRTDDSGEQQTLVLYNGHRYEGIPGQTDFRIIHFAEHGVPIQGASKELQRSSDREAMSTSSLMASARREDRAELQWRLSAPVSAVLLSLLAVPMARTSPRQGRYGKLAIGIGTYIIYSNLLGAARVWIEQGRLPTGVGLWPVHLLVFAIAALMLWRQYSLPARR